MTRIPALNILALGLKLTTHCLTLNNTDSTDSFPSLGPLGPPFQNTLHGVNVTASLFYPFSGMSHLLY
jgi:hypothetical protein